MTEQLNLVEAETNTTLYNNYPPIKNKQNLQRTEKTQKRYLNYWTNY